MRGEERDTQACRTRCTPRDTESSPSVVAMWSGHLKQTNRQAIRRQRDDRQSLHDTAQMCLGIVNCLMPTVMSISIYLFPIPPACLTCHPRIFGQYRLERRDSGAGNSVLRQYIVKLCHAKNRMVKVEAVTIDLSKLAAMPP